MIVIGVDKKEEIKLTSDLDVRPEILNPDFDETKPESEANPKYIPDENWEPTIFYAKPILTKDWVKFNDMKICLDEETGLTYSQVQQRNYLIFKKYVTDIKYLKSKDNGAKLVWNPDKYLDLLPPALISEIAVKLINACTLSEKEEKN